MKLSACMLLGADSPCTHSFPCQKLGTRSVYHGIFWCLQELPRRDGPEMSSSSLLDLSASTPASTLKRPTSLSRHASAAGFPLSPVIPRGLAKGHKPHIACSPCENIEGSLTEPEDISQLLADVACFADRLENLKDAVLREGESLVLATQLQVLLHTARWYHTVRWISRLPHPIPLLQWFPNFQHWDPLLKMTFCWDPPKSMRQGFFLFF